MNFNEAYETYDNFKNVYIDKIDNMMKLLKHKANIKNNAVYIDLSDYIFDVCNMCKLDERTYYKWVRNVMEELLLKNGYTKIVRSLWKKEIE